MHNRVKGSLRGNIDEVPSLGSPGTVHSNIAQYIVLFTIPEFLSYRVVTQKC